MKNLGSRIKKRRENLGMPLSDLSNLVGVSPSALSQIENAKAFPSIVTLKSIADNLHTTVSELIGEHEALSKNPVMKYSDKQFITRNQSGTSLFHLSYKIVAKQTDTLLAIFNEGSNSQDILKSHQGQTYIFIVKGELEFTLDETKYKLKKNDSLYFNAYLQQQAINKSHRETHILIVNTPPQFDF